MITSCRHRSASPRLRTSNLGLVLASLIGMAGLTSAPVAHASSIQVVANFTGTNGAYPHSALIDVGGTLYGVTSGFGAQFGGTLFSYDPSSYSLVNLDGFAGSIGAVPYANLTDVGRTLYGTTYGGGASGDGTIFSYDLSNGRLDSLFNFSNDNNGAGPYARITNVDGILYGTTSYGGASNSGTLFSYDLSSHSLKTLASFAGGTNGVEPIGGMTDVDGILYGATYYGGTTNSGTLFSYDLSSHSLKTIDSFIGYNGAGPNGILTNVGGTLYGTTMNGGVEGGGTLFSYDPSSGIMTTLTSFVGANGAYPNGGLVNADGVLYGTTYGFGAYVNGTASKGTLFSYDISSHSLTTLDRFTGSNGAYPKDVLTNVGGTLYGTASAGGGSGYGTLFSYQLPTPPPTGVPEPSSLPLLATGLIGMGLAVGWRRKAG